MRPYPLVLVALSFSALLLVAGCSKEGTAPAATTAGTTTPTTAAITTTAKAGAATKHAHACDMVTSAEMSTILGGTVTGAPGGNERPPSATECIYSSTAGTSPYAELQVDWGGGDVQALGSAVGLAKSAGPPGAVDPLQGLGDRAYQVTADQVFISTQGHLIMIRFLPRTSQVAAKARKIYETAQPRM